MTTDARIEAMRLVRMSNPTRRITLVAAIALLAAADAVDPARQTLTEIRNAVDAELGKPLVQGFAYTVAHILDGGCDECRAAALLDAGEHTGGSQ